MRRIFFNLPLFDVVVDVVVGDRDGDVDVVILVVGGGGDVDIFKKKIVNGVRSDSKT